MRSCGPRQSCSSSDAFVANPSERACTRKSRLVYRILESFASAELWHLGRLDLDRSTGAWVASLPRRALAQVVRTETYQRDDVALLDRITDRVLGRIDLSPRRGISYVRVIGNVMNQLRLVH